MDNTNLQKWALIAEIIGGLAVVASIVLVAFELNQNTDEAALNTEVLEITAFQNLSQSVIDLNNIVISDPSLARAMITAANQLEELKVEEQLRLRLFYTNLYRHGNTAYFQFRRGAISEEQLNQV